MIGYGKEPDSIGRLVWKTFDLEALENYLRLQEERSEDETDDVEATAGSPATSS